MKVSQELPSSLGGEGKKAFLVVKGSKYSGTARVREGRVLFEAEGANLALAAHAVHKMLVDSSNKALELWCANFKHFFFSFPGGSARAVMEAIEREQSAPPVRKLAASDEEGSVSRGWTLYQHESEYLRVFGPQLGTSASQFRISTANCTFQMSPSYPYLLVVPASISDDVLRACARYRSSSRLPVITWKGAGTLSRCAQPLIGMSGLGVGGRSAADEQVIDALRVSGSSKSPAVLYIVDARPLLNAHANKMTGGGTENMAWYPGCSLEQLDLVNIHKVRDSFDALQALCAAAVRTESGVVANGGVSADVDDGRWLAALHESRWLTLIAMILKGAMRVASLLRDGNPVLIHCSDGWDRTSQISSLAQIILDPYFRTRSGLAVLICKEWISFGHRFATRSGFSNRDPKEMCPVFLQWVDCLFQIVRKFPTAFEFNINFLVALVDNLYAGDNAAFCADNEKEMLNLLFAHDGSRSVWDKLVFTDDAKFVNPNYKPTTNHLFFKPYTWNIRLFENLYLRSL